MLPDRRAQKIRNRGVLAGLVLEQNEPGWRKASKRHLSWLWNKVNSLSSLEAKTRYRALVIKTVRVRKHVWMKSNCPRLNAQSVLYWYTNFRFTRKPSQ